MLGLHCCTGFSPVAANRGYSLAVACRLLTAEVACLAVEEREPCMCSRAQESLELWRVGSVAALHGS